jgi:predicted transcriptional regulator
MVIQLQVPDNIRQRFDELAQHAGQSREEVIIEAMEAYLAQIAEEDAAVAAGIAQADRGEVVDAEVVSAEAKAILLARGMTREQLAAIRAEVRAEMEAAYGVSLCE